MEVYSQEKMQQLLKDFYNLTHIKTCIYDASGNELCYYPEKLSTFCALLRRDAELDNRCKNCDKNAFSVCKKTHKQHVYTCHAGLLECVSPILYEEQIVGYIVLGQIKTHKQADFLQMSESKTFPAPLRKQLSRQFYHLPAIDMEKINSAIRILDACAGYEYLKKLLNNTENKIDAQLDKYINNHLSEDLSIPKLCSLYRLSHNEIYSIFKEYFNSTPAEYIKQRRLRYACELLKTTNFPINKIAKACGISDYNYFSKLFKQAFQTSPRAYRKN